MKYPGLLYFFDEKIKPIMLRGTRSLNPSPTGVLRHGISAIRQGDVDLWLYTKDGYTIAVDTGHINWHGTDEAFRKIGIDPVKIEHVFLTHSDVDHCGGIDVNADHIIYPNAQAYIGRGEEQYLEKKLHRQVKAGIRIYNCVTLDRSVKLLDDGDELIMHDIKVKCIEVPGHTAGHMCYLVDDRILFSGDSIALNREGGWAFWNFFCQYPEENVESLTMLRKRLEGIRLDAVCTGHSGILYDTEKLFLHTDTPAKLSKKDPFDPSAPHDVFRED